MRKAISLILAATLALSMISAVTLGIGAAIPASAITFDSEAEIDYYTAQAGKNCSENAIQDSGTAQGKAFKYSVIPAGWDGSVYASALRIAQNNSDGTVSAVKVTPGKSYSISFKYKNDKELTSWRVYTKLLYVDSTSNMGDFLHTANVGPDNWNPKSDIGGIAGVFGEQRVAVTNGWADYSYEFTVPTDVTNTELALVFILDSTVTDASLWVDDIAVTDLSVEAPTSAITFDSGAENDYYTAQAGKNCSENAIQDSGTAQGKAFKYSVIPAGWDGSVYASALRIAQNNSDGTVSTFNVTPGSEYEIRFKYKIDQNLATSGDDVYLKLLYVNSGNKMGDFLHTANIGPDNWSAQKDIGNISSKATNGWKEHTYIFTAQDFAQGTELALVPVFADITGENQTLWVDDITVTEFTQPGVVNMNFDTEAQRKYQSSVSALADGNPNSDFVEVEEGNYAAYIRELPSSGFDQIWYSSLKLSETKQNGSESIFNAVPGTRYTISFKAKAPQEFENNILSFYLCNINPSSGMWFSIIADTRHQEFANTHSLAELKEGWVEYSYTFNIPNDIGENTALALVPISDGWRTEAGILVDDVIITESTQTGTVNMTFETERQREYVTSVSALEGNIKVEKDFVQDKDGNYAAYLRELPGSDLGMIWYSSLKLTKSIVNGDESLMEVTPGSYYTISFKMKAMEELNNSITSFYLCYIAPSSGNWFANLSDTKHQSFENSATLADMKEGWIEYTFNFMAPNDIGNNTAVALVPVTDDRWGKTSVGVLIDDVTVEERFDVITIDFETNGGSTVAPVKTLPGESIPVFNPPEKSGYAFTGWYTDEMLTEPFNTNSNIENDITLYAGWASLENMSKSLNTGFEKEEWENAPYANDGTNTAVSDNAMTASVTWKHDVNEAYDGNSYINFEAGMDKLTDLNSERYFAVSLYNNDGTPFCVTEGKRYKISFAYRHTGQTSNGSMGICFYITNQTPSVGINKSNSTALLETGTIGPDKHDSEEWGEYSVYTGAAESGPVKLAVWCSSLNQALDVDNIVIEQVDDCVKVEYFQQNPYGEGKYSCAVRYGISGDLLIAGSNAHYDGYTFDGWRDENGKLYNNSHFPEADMTLYASWRTADDISKPAYNRDSDRVIDFEDTDGAAKFYGDGANSYSPGDGTFLVVNDPENAHSGNNYYQFYQCGHWMDEWLRRMKLYDPNSTGNQVYLEPNSVYKVSFWMNIEDVDAGNLYLATFPNKDNYEGWEVSQENYITETNQFQNFGKWVYYENTVITGFDEDYDGVAASLGFVFYGGYLTARIDDITVTKLKEITVTFDSNGGSQVNDISQYSHNTVIAPADPEREGYAFTGWYTDKELKNKFDFTGTIVTSDMTLYAGWEKIVVKEREPIYKTITDYTESEETVVVDVPDKELDEQIDFADKNKMGEINKQSTINDKTEETENLLLIIISVAGGVVLIAAAVVTVIVIKKRKKRT